MKDIILRIGSFVSHNFDKFLLSFIFIGLVTLTIHLIHDAEGRALAAGVPMTSTDFVNWAETQSGTVLGALLTLITGAVAKNALAQTDKTPNPNDQPKESSEPGKTNQ